MRNVVHTRRGIPQFDENVLGGFDDVLPPFGLCDLARPAAATQRIAKPETLLPTLEFSAAHGFLPISFLKCSGSNRGSRTTPYRS